MIRWFVATLLVFFVATFSRAAWLQVVQHDALAKAAERNRMLRQVIRAPRGRILDRNGEELATNTLRYSQIFVQDNQLRQRLIDKTEALNLMATAPATVRTSYERSYPYGPVTAHLVGYVDQPRESEEVVQGRSGIERLRQKKWCRVVLESSVCVRTN